MEKGRGTREDGQVVGPVNSHLADSRMIDGRVMLLGPRPVAPVATLLGIGLRDHLGRKMAASHDPGVSCRGMEK